MLDYVRGYCYIVKAPARANPSGYANATRREPTLRPALPQSGYRHHHEFLAQLGALDPSARSAVPADLFRHP